MSLLLNDPPFWAWWVLALLLGVIEILAPGFFFLWLGAAAVATGIVALVVADMTWQWQLLVFAVFSIASVALWFKFMRRHPIQTDDSTLNRRGEQYVGRQVVLVEPIVNGFGTARVDDTTWRVTGPDIPAGRRVRVVGADGTLLRVEPIAEDFAPTATAPARPQG
jgi:membrane protein implicated in regulation of membrane protease activity